MEAPAPAPFKNAPIAEDDRIPDKKTGANSIEVKRRFNFLVFFCHKPVAVNFLR